MLTILHGDNTTASRTELTKRKQEAKGKELRDIDGKHCDETELRQALETSSLFGDTLLVVIEHLFTTLGRKQKEIKKTAEIIAEASNTIDIILWEPKELGKTALSSFPHATVLLHKTPAVIFTFLDSIAPGQAPKTLTLGEQVLKTEAPELVLYMIASRIRQLIQVKDGASGGSISPWQLSRLTNQAKFFTMDKLLMMHQNLTTVEHSTKNGTNPYPLHEAILAYIIQELST